MPATNPAPAPAWIDRSDTAAAWVAAALHHTTVALDTEFIRTQTFHAELGLVQLASEAAIALVDPLPAGVGATLVPLLAAPGVVKIVHSASEDLEVLGHALGQVPAPLFDTQIAAVLCGYEQPPSYQKLVQAELGIALDKHATRTDWLKRPLDPEQLRYAAEDVLHLHALHARLAGQLAQLGRMAWMDEECARAVARAQQDQDPHPHLKVRAVERMSAAQQQRLWRLLRWRDREAAERNRPRRWILDIPIAVRAALMDKPDRVALEAAVAADGKPSPRLAQKLEAVLGETASADELAIPLHADPTEFEKSRARELRERATQCANELGMAPDFLLNRRALEHWARHGRLPKDLCGWRESVLGL
ncbi:MAG: ribonuclease D [Xanthomonadales bacterium]|nr:Ribonuclease D [Xanthomonadales bacterium]MCC6591730.1 ribonuclease D [Xanthomonadales bacterium]MCE7929751.1 ribonuclease D [Xanthomonadales bacterium PRO6]